ncbi:MAG: chemotaxis protein CheW [Bacteriovorax sp.]|nr:chemotaxis protein CheW [Bacteriovorax sp.]
MNTQNEEIKIAKIKDEIFGSFYIGTMEVAINVKAIHEVVNIPDKIIKMPLSPDFLIGVFNLRGLIIPIINLKVLLKFDDYEMMPSQKISIVDHEGAKVGLLFDSTSEIIRVNIKDISEFSYGTETSHKVISGAIKLDSGSRLLQIIDPFALVSIDNIPQIIDQQNKQNLVRVDASSLHESRQKCISFSINEIKMGFEISGIHEITKVPEIQKSALQNELCIGMINLRGQTVPVIDLAALLGASKGNEKKVEDKRIIVLKIENELFGLLVDAVESINTYKVCDVMPIPLLSSTRSKIFLGCISLGDVGDVILLNYQEVLSNKEILEITQGHSKIYSSGIKEQTATKRSVKRQAYISFKLDHLFGVSIKDIREIINYSDEIISAPGMPTFVKGILNLRGKLITIIDTRSLYVMNQSKVDVENSKILIFDSGEERFGLIVDSVESIVTVDDDKKMKVPSLMVQKVQDQFQDDIKEIVTFQQGEEKEGVLIILNMEPVTTRVKKHIAA